MGCQTSLLHEAAMFDPRMRRSAGVDDSFQLCGFQTSEVFVSSFQRKGHNLCMSVCVSVRSKAQIGCWLRG